MPSATTSAIPRNFRLTHPEPNVWIVHDVPVFYETLRDGDHYDRSWLARASANAREAERDGHLPPMHVHHRFRDDVKAFAAGTMRFVGVKPARYKGRDTMALHYDLIVTNEAVARDIIQNRLLWRSPEVSFEEARVVSLALLDHEAPFFEGPITTVSLEGAGGVPAGKNASAAFSWCSRPDSPVVAFARSNGLTRVLFREEAMTAPSAKKPTDDPEAKEKAGITQMGDDEKKKGPPDDAKDDAEDAGSEPADGETPGDVPGIDASPDPATMGADGLGQPAGNPLMQAMQTTPATLEQCIEALGFLQQLVDKMRNGGAGGASGAPAPLPPTNGPAAQMSKPDAKITQMQAELDALKAKDRARDLDAEVTTFADASLSSLAGTAVGADPATRGNIVAFARKHGVEAAKEYVAGLKTHAVPLAGSGRLTDLVRDDVPDDLRSFSAEGPEGYEQARVLYGQWEQLRARGFCRDIPFKTYVERERQLTRR